MAAKAAMKPQPDPREGKREEISENSLVIPGIPERVEFGWLKTAVARLKRLLLDRLQRTVCPPPTARLSVSCHYIS